MRRPHYDADSGRGKGLNSPHGRRGAILAHFGWSLDYLLNGIAWSAVNRMMLDAPRYDVHNDSDEIQLTDNNSKDIMNYVNNLM